MEIRKIQGSEYNEVLERIIEFCHEHKEIMYRPKHLVRALNLDVPARGLQTSLRQRHEEAGLLRIYHKNKAYYGYSETCGSGVCFSSWCEEESISCRTGKGNPKLEFFK